VYFWAQQKFQFSALTIQSVIFLGKSPSSLNYSKKPPVTASKPSLGTAV
jgi:hypothetical protein